MAVMSCETGAAGPSSAAPQPPPTGPEYNRCWIDPRRKRESAQDDDLDRCHFNAASVRLET